MSQFWNFVTILVLSYYRLSILRSFEIFLTVLSHSFLCYGKWTDLGQSTKRISLKQQQQQQENNNSNNKTSPSRWVCWSKSMGGYRFLGYDCSKSLVVLSIFGYSSFKSRSLGVHWNESAARPSSLQKIENKAWFKVW